MIAYINELMASRECVGEDRKVVCIGDSGQEGTDVYWCAPHGRWMCITLEEKPRFRTTKDIALVRMDEDTDPKAGLVQVVLASDCERGHALWLLEAEKLDRLAAYGDAIKVLWSSQTRSGSFTDALYKRERRADSTPEGRAGAAY
jgi:hypothetical protein